MKHSELAERVRESHDRHFGPTALRERLRDLQNEVAELVHHRDDANLLEEIGDAGWSLVQLCNERGVDLASAIERTIAKLDARAKGRRVALLGMSANPVTNAHLTMALEILALSDVDEVWFYPVGEHPWGKKMMPAEHRLEMLRRATARYPRLKVCDFEIVHGPEKIYPTTRETALILRDHFLPAYPGYQFAWVMGSDVAQTFERWEGAAWLAEHLRVFIVHRLGYDFDKASSLLAEPKHLYLRDNVVTSNISSTLVRERGKSYDHDKLVALVPDVVWEYLVEHRLLDPDVLR
jgi:nicotinate (nicotinamide) nucleotide adenylyltransferase